MKTAAAALGLLLAFATATPVELAENPSDSMLEKRDTEIVYLANCQHSVSCCGGPTNYSEVLYYATSASSNNGAVPAANNQCRISTSNYIAWEGDQRQCTFPTGVTFTTHIDADAQSRALYTWSGWGANGKNWNCYKDNQRTLFTTSGPEWADVCKSVYYCIPQ
ncbi:hypothetical protein B0T17DRAFT_616526 [Bombardia bombarda]|uniref:Uncharacterized protein n=1 Tax=Bombardia bombarda TaxID=252184 RepID=A0AA39XC09_9PEZI|nr:hypothetical protein B0T17DRAFT_616526 [Bombardia bombarda]